MDVRNCKRCKKLFQYNGNSICPTCYVKEEEEFEKVREHLKENQGDTINMVSEATGVAPEKILRYLREGRIEIVGDDPKILLDCESCGASIRTGRFCANCAKDIEKKLKAGVADKDTVKPASNKSVMHLRKVLERKQ